MFKPSSGRKPESGVWKYYAYEASTDKSRCQIDSCGALLKGKNATNLIYHLKSKHKDIAVDFVTAEKLRKQEQKDQVQLKVSRAYFLCIFLGKAHSMLFCVS